MDTFDEWILSNKEVLKLEVEHLTWIEHFFDNYSDFSANIQLGSNRFDGRGMATSPDLALRKALVEAFERAISLETLSTTNGVAGHTDLEIAKLLAFEELLERDCFLSHFYTDTPFEKIRSPNLNKSVTDFLSKCSGALSFYKMKKTNFGQGILALISNGESWGAVVGLSFGVDLHICLNKAFLEAFRQLYHIHYREEFSLNISLNDFLNQTTWDFNDHKLLLMNVDYYKMIEHLFLAANSKLSGLIVYDKAKIKFQVLSSRNAVLKTLPLVVVRCFGDSTQQLHPGPTYKNQVDEEGLTRFANGSRYKLNLLPHPFN